MLEFLQLAAIHKRRTGNYLSKFSLHQSTQSELAEDWDTQYNLFLDSITEIPFDPGYKPESNEMFSITGFELPDWLENVDTHSIVRLPDVRRDEYSSIAGVIAAARDDQQNELMLFQNFTRTRVIRRRRVISWTHDGFRIPNDTSLTLDSKLSAVYIPNEQKLLFVSFRTVNSFLPLMEYYRDASEQEIRAVMSHEIFDPEDIDAIAQNPNQWFRRRFALLRDSKILDEYTASEIKACSPGYDVAITTSGDKIIFPAEKSEAKKLLQFLCEERFKGAITEILYETNSKRQAG